VQRIRRRLGAREGRDPPAFSTLPESRADATMAPLTGAAP
jgi:hypothetical protein